MGNGAQILKDTLIEMLSNPQQGIILLIVVCTAATVENYLFSGCAVVWLICLIGSLIYVRLKKTKRAIMRNQLFLFGSFMCPVIIRAVCVLGPVCPIEYFGMTLLLVGLCTFILVGVFMLWPSAGKKSNPLRVVAKIAIFVYMGILLTLAVSMPTSYYIRGILDERILLFALAVFCLAACAVAFWFWYPACGIDFKLRIRMSVSCYKAATAVSLLFDIGFAFVTLLTMFGSLLFPDAQSVDTVDCNLKLLLCVLFLFPFCLPFKITLFLDQHIVQDDRNSEISPRR